MPKTLVIVESPTKAKTISKFLGSGYVVESSFGHVRDLPKSKMGIDIENGTFLPHYAVPKDKADRVKKLKSLAKGADVIFATDEDREGEAISWHLANVLDIDPEKAKRIVFHEITKRAIDEALAHPRHLDLHLVDAQQARRVLDRLVGYELSPFLWKKVARGLSAGRVQSVAVRLVVEREREREAFKPQEFWTLEGLFQPQAEKNKEENIFPAGLFAIDEKKLDKFALANKDQVDSILTDLKNAAYSISSIEKHEAKRTPPAPFTTSTLQQRANNALGYSAKQTMRLAQQLYEGIDIGEPGSVGLITYMRTDSLNLSTLFIDDARDHIKKTLGDTFLAPTPRVYKNKSKGAQEAHEAIRPTQPMYTPESIETYLTPQQHKLYRLIWNRAMATQMSDARVNKTTIDITSGKYTFRANGQTMIFAGWLALYPETMKETMLPELKEKEAVNCLNLKSEQHATEPPPRYSDASLVKAMEEYGIGRPSTYAPTIATIEARNYVERDDNKRLKPTAVGTLVTDVLMEHFSAIVDYAFTATMEGNLDEIALGEKDWQPIIATFYRPFHETIVQKTEDVSKQSVAVVRELGKDPKTGKPLAIRVGRFGPFIQKGSQEDEEKPTFTSIPPGVDINTLTLEQALTFMTLPRTLGTDEDGKEVMVAIGRFGPYIKIEKTYYSLKADDPYTITFDRAKEVIKEAKEKKVKEIIKKFDGSDIIVKDGRFGPYITDGKKNAKIPKDTDPTSLDLKTCEELIANAKPSYRKRRSTRK